MSEKPATERFVFMMALMILAGVFAIVSLYTYVTMAYLDGIEKRIEGRK